MQAQALWNIARQKAEIRAEQLPSLNKGEVRLKMLYSGLSRGTEKVIFNGLLMTPEREAMRVPYMGGAFPFPVKYGYCAVGEVISGEHMGKRAFCMHPHQDFFQVHEAALTFLPDNIPSPRATLLANMETALNAVWDGEVTVGQRVCVVGAGVVGLLIAYLVSQIKATQVWVIDIDENKKPIAKALGLRFQKPLDAPDDCDVVFHTSATQAGLACALSCAGIEAKVVVLSWYGDHAPLVPLGASFHPKRLQLISSQVGMIAKNQRPRTSYKERLQLALECLQDEALDGLISETVAFQTLPQQLPRLFNQTKTLLSVAVEYLQKSE